jgi:FkbM family methyltransferase
LSRLIAFFNRFIKWRLPDLGQSRLPLIPRELVEVKSIIVDVGCRWGFAERFIKAGNDFFLIGFDPDTEECRRLGQLYSSDSVVFVAKGLAGRSGTRTLYVTQNPACSSLLKPDPFVTNYYPALACAREVLTKSVDVVTLDAWAKAVGLERIDHIKVDTQGTELEILQGGDKILQSLRSIEIEVEFNAIYENQPLFSDVDHYLRGRGFRLWKLTNAVHYSEGIASTDPVKSDLRCYDDSIAIHEQIYPGQLYWANAHYVRQDLIDGTSNATASQLNRDVRLFETLELHDVAAHIKRKFGLLPVVP